VARSSLLAPHRLVIAAVVVVLAVLTLLFLRGPDVWQRYYYPLEHVDEIARSAKRHEVNPYLVAAMIDAESDWEEGITSEAGAVGLMQVLPETAEDLRDRGLVDEETVSGGDLSDPAVNIEYGTAYIRLLVERYHEIETAVAAYNAGMANVDEWVEEGEDIRDTIEFPETRHYVLRVVRARDVYEELYPAEFPGWGEDGW
jgi:soluble lytic murein transglycosylase